MSRNPDFLGHNGELARPANRSVPPTLRTGTRSCLVHWTIYENKVPLLIMKIYTCGKRGRAWLVHVFPGSGGCPILPAGFRWDLASGGSMTRKRDQGCPAAFAWQSRWTFVAAVDLRDSHFPARPQWRERRSPVIVPRSRNVSKGDPKAELRHRHEADRGVDHAGGTAGGQDGTSGPLGRRRSRR